MAIGNLFVRVTGDEKSLKETTDKIKRKFKEAGDVAEKDMPEQVKRGTKKMENSFASLGKYIIGIFSITAIFSFVKQLYKAGSDLEETSSKFNQVFKGQGDANKRFEDLAKTLGRSELQMKQFGSTTGAILKPLGFATEDALDLSEAITRLSIDIASFNNVSDDQANNALNRALTGEREALKSLGIAINETDIKNEYMRLGFKLTGDELSKQGKALATLSLLYNQTSDAQGDAIRTGESWANQLKRFRGSVLDAFAQAGKQLSNESATTLATLNKYVIAYGVPLLKVIVDTFKGIVGQLSPLFKEIIGGVTTLFNALSGNTNKAIGEQLSFAGVIAKVVNFLGSAVAFLVAVVRGAFQNIGSLLVFVGGGFFSLVIGLGKMASAIGNIFDQLGPVISSRLKNIFFEGLNKISSFVNAVKNLIPGLNQIIGDISNPFQKTNVVNFKDSGFVASAKEIKDNFVSLGSFAIETFQNTTNELDSVSKEYLKRNAEINSDFKKGAVDSAKTQAVIADQIKKQKEEEKRTLEELVEKYKNVQSASQKAGQGSKEGSAVAKEAMTKLKDETKKLEDAIKDLEKAQKDEDDAVKKYHKDRVDELRKIGEELDNNIKKYEETIKMIDKERDSKLGETKTDEQNKLAERYAEIQKEIADLQKSGDSESQQKINDLLREKAIIQGTISQSLLDEAERVSNLTEAERIQLEFAQRRKEIENEASQKKTDADAELQVEQDKLRKKQAIIDYFNTVDHFTRANLKKLEEDENFKKLDVERQNEILRLAEERIALEDKKNIRIGLEQQVNDEIQRLSNLSTEIQKTNLGSLSKEYKKIIADLDSAIQRQRTLNALRSSPGGGQGFAQGGYTGDGGVNDVAGVVHKGEYVVPQHVLARSPELLGSLEAMRQGKSVTNNTDKSMKFGDVIVQSPIDLQLFLEKQKFHLT